MRALFWIALAMIVVCGPASAQVSVADQADPRFDLGALQGICGNVRNGLPRSEQQVLTAARVEAGDSDAEMRTKVGALFRHHMPQCNGFNVSRGSILKYAVAQRRYNFLFDAANVWHVDLNMPDQADGLTVLDYTVAELERHRGMNDEEEFTAYRDMLVRAGARTTAQLEAGEDCRPSTRCRESSR